ncbi:MAG: ATP-binding cassette domain-containing protein [Limisphaerales bacterium]
MKRLPLVQLDNVSVSLAGRRILHGVNWRWRPGESWAVLGANGSGKSTFLRLVAGELHPDPLDGGRRTYGLDGKPDTSAVDVREHIAFVSPEQQERYLNIEWVRTGRDVLLTGFHQTDYLYRRLTPEQKAAAEELAEELCLGPLLRRDVQTLSQGEFRRVLIARALLGKPRVLLLDEFTDGLDATMRDALLAAVQRAADAGTSVLCATHRADELIPALRRRLVLEAGRITPRPAGTGSTVPGRARLRRAHDTAGGGASAASISGSRPEKLAPLASLRSQWGSTESRPTSPDKPDPFLFRLRNASVYLDRKPVLKKLSWTMRPGEHWAITGRNGSGKSTFLKLLLGELHPAVGGTIERFNEARRHTLWEIRARVGYVGPDLQTAYRDDLTVAEVVASGFFASIGLMDDVTPAQWRRVRELLSQFALAELAGRNFLQLSYGQRRRVLLVRALVHAPQVLLLDEPLDGLDAESLARMRDHLAQLSRTGIALVIVTHRREELSVVPFKEARLS